MSLFGMLNEVKNDYNCKGLYWRAYLNSFLSSHNSIEDRISLRFLKKMSCEGCPECDWIWEYISESIDCGGLVYKDIKHGKIYTYHVNSYKGYYDLYAEIDSIEFVEVKENEFIERREMMV